MSSNGALYPIAASTFAPEIDCLTFVLLSLCGLVTLLVFGLICFFGIRYRKNSPYSRLINPRRETYLEWGWTVGTLMAFLGLCIWGAVVYFKMHIAPEGSMEISVVGKQWMWKFQHPSGQREINELHLPVGQPILLSMTSQDVIHSFFVPAFRVKQDVLPSRYTYTWFQATKTGQYHLFCTQYCGTSHADMRGRIIVLTPQDYQRWLQTGGEGGIRVSQETMASRGRTLFTNLGCISCHGENPGVKAPSLAHLYGTRVGLSDGTTVIADENYLRESILYPAVKIVQGYQNIMPTFLGQTREEDLLDLIAYIKSLQVTPAGQDPHGPLSSSAIPSPTPQRNIP